MDLALVTARWREDLRWLRRVPAAFRIEVLNKGEPVEPGRPDARVTPLPNVGREAHAYLHHLAEHYDRLADLTVFVQGHPFDHVPDLHARLRAWAEGRARMDGFAWLGFLLEREDKAGRLFLQWSKNPERRALDLPGFWRAVFGDAPCPEFFDFFGGANFAVTRDVVRARPRAFYARACEVAASFPEAAHCFERMWDRVFGVDGIPLALRDAPRPVYLKPIRRLLAPAHDL